MCVVVDWTFLGIATKEMVDYVLLTVFVLVLLAVMFFTGGCRDNLYSSSYPSSSFYYTKREAACIVSRQSLFLFSISCDKANYGSEPGYKKH
jgi:hypothetical protein